MIGLQSGYTDHCAPPKSGFCPTTNNHRKDSPVGKRGTPCTICSHKARASIEVAIVNRVPARAIAARFEVSKDAVMRHGRNHLTPTQRAALLTAQRPPATAVDLEALRTTESEGLLCQLVAQRARLQQSAELALELGDVRASVAAEGAITSNLALVGKLLGQLVQRHDVRHTSVLLSPDYLALRSALIAALKPYPDAAKAVGAALYRLESDAARDITDQAAKPAPAVIDHAPLPPPPPVVSR
jgi:hypothetical protein